MKLTRLLSIAVFGLCLTAYAQEQNTYIKSLDMPCYPPLARQARIMGAVKVKVDVAGDGTVRSAQSLEGHPMLREAAVANVKTWKFVVGGPFSTIVSFEYKLDDEPESRFERCAGRVVFDSFKKVTVAAHTPMWQP